MQVFVISVRFILTTTLSYISSLSVNIPFRSPLFISERPYFDRIRGQSISSQIRIITLIAKHTPHVAISSVTYYIDNVLLKKKLDLLLTPSK